MRKLKPFIKATIFILITLVTCNMGSAYVLNNGSGSGYGGDGSRVSGSPIENYIVEGAGYFLAANANVQELLRMVELQDLQGVDYAKMYAVIDSAFINMINAVETYDKLIDTAEATPYNETVIALLAGFDYNGFKTQYGLNGDIFAVAANYLKNGDITGVFKYTYNEYMKIFGLLIPMRYSIAYGKVPALSSCWQVNEKFSSLSIFGSIVARIFAAIQQY